MTPRPAARLDLDVEPLVIRNQTWFRHARRGLDFWHRPDPPADGRWQHGAIVAAIYLADSIETAWAEHYRGLSERGLPPEIGFPRDLWRCRVSLSRVADLSTEERLTRVGLRLPRPARSDWPRFELVGEALFAAGWAAVLAPSAARPEIGRSLCVFAPGSGRVRGLSPQLPPDEIPQAPALPRGLRT